MSNPNAFSVKNSNLDSFLIGTNSARFETLSVADFKISDIDLSLSGTLTVAGASTLNGLTVATGNLGVTVGTLSVGGASTLNGLTLDTGNLGVTLGNLTVTEGNLEVTAGTLNVGGVSTLTGAVTCGNDVTLTSGNLDLTAGSLGIGAVPVAQAALEVASTSKGILFPRMTTAQRDAIATPPDGLVVYNTDLPPARGLNLFVGGAWVTLAVV